MITTRAIHRFRAVIVLLSASIACSSTKSEPWRPPVATVTVRVSAASILVGGSATAMAVLRDGDGNELHDRIVSWASTDASVATVDPAGSISAASPGTVSISASSEGVIGSAPLSVTAGAACTLSRIAGDVQFAARGAPVPVAPRVLVSDAHGQPVTGATVTFSASAGGSVSTPRAVTGSTGEAACDAWVLGSTIGAQTLAAWVDPAVVVTFSATALETSETITVQILAPATNGVVGDVVPVSARVTSTYQLARVTAALGDHAPVPLTFGTNGWGGTLPADGLPSPSTQPVVVTASDGQGHVTMAAVSVRLDRPPALTVTLPAGSVARPELTVSATCADDGGCAAITVRKAGDAPELLRGTNSVRGDIDLAAYDGQELDLQFAAADAAGNVVTQLQHVYVEASSHLRVVGVVPGATLLDFSDGRVLYAEGAGSASALRIRDMATSTTQHVATGARSWVGYLAPRGALYLASATPPPSTPAAYEWRDGAAIPLGDIAALGAPHVKTPFATLGLYTDGASEVILRDLAAGTTTSVARGSSPFPVTPSVAANGDVVYGLSLGTGPSALYRWSHGVSSQLATNPAGWDPLTDGTLVVYSKCPGGVAGRMGQWCNGGYTVVMNDGAGETVLSPARDNRPYDTVIANGWIAYTRADPTSASQVWRHGPDGEEQVSIWSTSSAIAALGDDGRIVVDHSGRRYLVAPGGAPLDIGSSLGTTLYRDGAFYRLVGDTVFEVAP